MLSDEHVAALRALLRHDLERYKRFYSAATEDPYGLLVAAALVEAAERRFGDNRSLIDIIRFVATARARQNAAEQPIDPNAAEKLLRAALGDTSAIGESDEDVYARTELALLDELVAELELDDNGLDEFLARARDRAERLPG